MMTFGCGGGGGAAAGMCTGSAGCRAAGGGGVGRDGRRDGGPEAEAGDLVVGVWVPDEGAGSGVEKKSTTAGLLSVTLWTGEEARGSPANGSSDADMAEVADKGGKPALKAEGWVGCFFICFGFVADMGTAG